MASAALPSEFEARGALRVATQVPTRRPLRVAIAGCGRIARVHCGYLRGLPNVQVVAACDRVASAAAGLAKDFGIEAIYTDLARMLDAVRPDAVHVLTPPATHAEVAMIAMQAGAHVLVEKPLAVDIAQADAMLDMAVRTGRTLAVDHNRWFDPVMQRATGLLSDGALGDLVGVEVFQGAVADESQPPAGGERVNWRATLPGGVMHDVAPHPAYQLCNLVGPIRGLDVQAIGREGTLEEIRVLASGERCLGTLTLSMRTRPMMNTVRLFGTRASAEINFNQMTLVVRREYSGNKVVTKVMPSFSEAAQLVAMTLRNGVAFVTGRQRYYPGMGVLIERFYRHLAGAGAPPTTGEDGRDVVRLLDEIWVRAAAAMERRGR